MTKKFHIPKPKENNEINLSWKDKHYIDSISYYPAILKESYGESKDNWFNKLYYGDNLKVLGYLLKEYKGKIDLVYIDPPFNSKANYKRNNKIINKDKIYSFDEIQYTDKWNDSEYLQFIYERLIIIRELLSDNGSIYVHCDSRVNWLIRGICDEIFGYDNLVNEIICHYTGGGRSENYFSKKHDTIFVYRKSTNYIFISDLIRIPYKETSGYAKGGIVSQTGKKYMPNPLGTLPDDVWDIPIINPLAGERLDYPTQKPETLLERILKAFSNPNSIILDCFMGSGTTQAVAMKLGRRFIGADSNLGAIQTTTKRLLQNFSHAGCIYPNFHVYKI